MGSSGRATNETIKLDNIVRDIDENQDADSATQQATLDDVLQLARAARVAMNENLDDYKARFVKQEIDTSGVLTEETEIQLKVQTRLRGDDDDAPMRVYLHFLSPESVKGREVIWAADMHDGKLVAHEGGLLGFTTVHLDPTGFLAMRGQRYPIYEIGMVRLVEKLIERGEKDLGNPDITVTITDDFELDEVVAKLIQVRRAKPSGAEDDFSLAEIVIDPERQLILRYRSYGWPSTDAEGEESEVVPLQESYTYHDIKVNVGLTEEDFNPSNPEYRYP